MDKSTVLLVKSPQTAKMSIVVADRDQLAVCSSIFSAVVPSSLASEHTESQKMVYSSAPVMFTTAASRLTAASSIMTSSSSTSMVNAAPCSNSEAELKRHMTETFMTEKVGKCSQILKPLAALVQTSSNVSQGSSPASGVQNQRGAVSSHESTAAKEADALQFKSCSLPNTLTSAHRPEITELSPILQTGDNVTGVSFPSRNDALLPCPVNILPPLQSSSTSNGLLSIKTQNNGRYVPPNHFPAGSSNSGFGGNLVVTTSAQTMSDLSFIPIIFTNAEGETQQITADDLPPNVFSQVSLLAMRNHIDSQKSSELSGSVSTVPLITSKSGKQDSGTRSEANDSERLSDSVEKLNLAPPHLFQNNLVTQQTSPKGCVITSVTSGCHNVGAHQGKVQSVKQVCISEIPSKKRQQGAIAELPTSTQLRAHQGNAVHSQFQQCKELAFENTFQENQNSCKSSPIKMSVSSGSCGRITGVLNGTPLTKVKRKLCADRDLHRESMQGDQANHSQDKTVSPSTLHNLDLQMLISESNSSNADPRADLPKSKECQEEHLSSLVEKVACFKCKFCNFLSMNEDTVTCHAQKEHSSHVSGGNNEGLHCPGCSNIFFSRKSFEVHLTEDHNTADQELKQILDSFGDILNKYSNKKRKQPSEPLSGNITLQADGDAIHWQGRDEASKRRKLHKLSADEKQLQCPTPDSTPADETGKIRVRKLSSLEKFGYSVNGSSVISACPKDDSEHEIRDDIQESTEELENSLLLDGLGSSDIHSSMTAGTDGLSPTVSNLGETLTQMQQVENEFHQEQQVIIDEAKETEFEDVHSGTARKQNHAIQSQISCDVMIEEMNDKHILHEVILADVDNCGEASSVVFCLESSQSGSSVDEYFPEAPASSSVETIRNEDENDRENLDTTNIILEKALSEELLVSKAEKIVRINPGKKQKGVGRKRGLKSVKRSKIKQENDTISGYRCGVPGCHVRLISHDNMQYHIRCHDYIIDSLITSAISSSAEPQEDLASKSKNQFTCPECSYVIRSWAQLSNHLWRCHSIDMELYSCDKCNYKTSSFSNMSSIHKPIHSDDKSFLCDSCGKGFKTPKQLRNHKAIHVKRAKSSEGRVDQCGVCGRSFVDARMLRNHIEAVHNKVRPYMCSECGHTAASRSSLKMHLRQHTGDRPYKCEECEYQTSDHNSLRRHKKRHTGEKPYKCPYCDYSSIQSSTYKSHLKSKHPGQDGGLLFSCRNCAFRTINHEIYLSHVAEHETEISFVKFRPDRKLMQRNSASELNLVSEPSAAHGPIFVRISDGSETAYDVSTIEAVVQNVSEAIIPGSQVHLLYNSVSMTDFPQHPNSLVDSENLLATACGETYMKSNLLQGVRGQHNSLQKASIASEEHIIADVAEANKTSGE